MDHRGTCPANGSWASARAGLLSSQREYIKGSSPFDIRIMWVLCTLQLNIGNAQSNMIIMSRLVWTHIPSFDAMATVRSSFRRMSIILIIASELMLTTIIKTLFAIILVLVLLQITKRPSFANIGDIWLFQATTEQSVFIALFLCKGSIHWQGTAS